MPRLTLKTVRDELARIGMTVRHTEDGDYRVALRNGTEAQAYYTDDLEDALNTARAMRGFLHTLH